MVDVSREPILDVILGIGFDIDVVALAEDAAWFVPSYSSNPNT